MKKKVMVLSVLPLLVLASCGKTESEASENATDSAATESTSVDTTVYTVTISGESTMTIGDSQTLTAKCYADGVEVEGATFEWTTSSEKYLEVDSVDGIVTALDLTGTATVYATCIEHTDAIGELEITIVEPELNTLGLAGNYTLEVYYAGNTQTTYTNIICSDNELYAYFAGGWYSDGNARGAWYWYEDDKIFAVEAQSKTEIYYYPNEPLTGSDGNALSATSFKSEFDVSSYITAAAPTYLGEGELNNEEPVHLFYAAGESGALDPLASFIVSTATSFTASQILAAYSKQSETPVSVFYNYTDSDGTEILVGQLCGLNAMGSVDFKTTLLSYYFYDAGTSSLGLTPTAKYFHDGGEAGDDGDGEDFDGTGDSGDTSDSGDSSFDGE